MNILLAITIGVLYGAGAYLLLRRSMIKVLLGLALIANASNLLIFTSSRIVRAGAPLVPDGERTLREPHSDPLAQAMVLTAIVIAFGVLAFTLALAKRTADTISTDDLDALSEVEP